MQKKRVRERVEVYSKLTSLLALKKEYPQYTMSKALDISYRTLLRYLKRFEKEGSIKMRTEPSLKGGKEKKIYSLTFRGLVSALLKRDVINNYKNLEKVIVNHQDMLLAFRKYRSFENMKEFYFRLVKITFMAWYEHESRHWRTGYEITWQKEEYWRDLIDESFFAGPFGATKSDDEAWETMREKFMQICKKDPEISRVVRRAIARQERKLKETKDNWENIEKKE